jgi:7-carboxy-7-deazaguanine synthase
MPQDLEKRLAPLSQLRQGELLIHEVYASIQGESSYAGLPCVFVRTTTCNLRCRYCDTPHAFFEGIPMALADVTARVESFALPLVEITGGEPLLQPAVLPLMTLLCDRGHTVLLETSGALDVRPVDPRVIRIMDLKAPWSGEEASNLEANVSALGSRDEVKLVLADRADYEWAKAKMTTLRLAERCRVLMGPVFGRLDPQELATWVLADRLPVRMQLQLHKYIWDPEARGV